jgi:hypothetical protein
MTLTRFLGIGWTVTAFILAYVLLFARSGGLRSEEPIHSESPNAGSTVSFRPEGDAGRTEPPPARAKVETPLAAPADVTQTEAYQRALARVTLPTPTGDAEVDRRTVLRHWHRNCGLYEPGSFQGPIWDLTRLQTDPRINPTKQSLTSEQIGEVAKLVAGDVQERAALWSRRLELEGEAIAAAIDAGSFEWFGPTAAHQDPSLSPQEQQMAFERRMNETWGPMGIGWTCMMTDVRGVPHIVYVTPQNSPDLFDAIRACVGQEQIGLEAARRYVERLGR